MKIPQFEVRMPSYEESRAASLAWFDRAGATFLDRWPKDLMALSIPTEFVRFPIELADTLYDGRPDAPTPAKIALADELDRVIGWKRRFPRLNSRSPKDAMWPFEALSVLSGKDVITTFACSERILDDLVRFSFIPEIPAYVCLRDWVFGWNTAREYRCFVRDGVLIAVTHYDYTKAFRPPHDGGRALRSSIEAYFAETLKPRLPMETVVFDLYANYDGSFLMIEINPYGLSDPCHFKTYDAVENSMSFIEYARPAPDDGGAG